jgi:hypothetical protein
MTHNLIDNMIDSIKKLYEGFKKWNLKGWKKILLIFLY